MQQVLTLSYYFTPRPDANFQFTKVTILLIVVFYLLGFLIKLYRSKSTKDPIIKKMIRKYPGRMWLFGTLLLFLLLLRENGIPYLSMRIWWFLLLLYIMHWAIEILINFKKEYKRRMNQASQNRSKSKYLPRQKRR